MNTRRLLLAVRRKVALVLSALDSMTAEPLEREQLLSDEELRERARRENLRARRAARVRWYQHRQRETEVPESLKYYEAVHGTRATIAMLKRAARKLDD